MKKNKKKIPDVNKRLLVKLGGLYTLIAAVINFLGYLLVKSIKLSGNNTEADIIWAAFKQSHRTSISITLTIIMFLPLLFVAFYLFCVKDEDIKGRIINFPVMFSFIGSLCWVFSYVYELGCLIHVSRLANIRIHSIAVVSLLNIIQSALFIGVFLFFVLDGIQRKFVLPKYFPDGNLTKFKGTIQISTRILIDLFYISVGIVPAIYLFSVIVSYSYTHDFEVELITYQAAFMLLVLGFVLLKIFSKYFTTPLFKLKTATDNIKQEKYDEKLNIVSADDFGVLSDNFNDMAETIDYKNNRIVAIQDSIIRGMAVMVESNDNNTGGHIIRTSTCVSILVHKLKKHKYNPEIKNSYWRDLIKAAPMHDLGKIAIDDSVLRKPGKFTPEEYEIMKRHTVDGARIVEQVLNEVDDEQFTEIAKNVAHYHHEKWDGTGYPTGASRYDIPLEARIMALADVFDALVSKRCYKDEFSFDKAFQIIEESLGTHFDPELGLIFLKCRPELEAFYKAEFDKDKNK